MTHAISPQKDLFILDDEITYLNCANMSPVLRSVRQAGLESLETRSAPWNITGADWFTNSDKLRGLAARILQTSNNNIALIPSASYGIALAAKNLRPKKGKDIIVLEQQFPSNYYVWEKLSVELGLRIIIVKRDSSRSLTTAILEAINKNTGIVTIPNCHWIDGEWIDLQQVSKAVKAVDAYLMLDLSQSMGVLPTDIDSIQPDFAVSVGYKWMLGPYGLGYLYVSPQWQERGEPLEYSWLTKKGSDDFSRLTDYVEDYREGARKFDMGEVAGFNLVPMAIAALEQILEWGPYDVQEHITKLTARITEYKKATGLFNDNSRGVGHIASIPLKDLNIQELKERLSANKIVISFRGSTIRVSPHLYNDVSDIDKLLDCLKD